MNVESETPVRARRFASILALVLFWIALVAVSFAIPGVAQPAPAGDAAPFTAEERARLSAGELVRRPTQRREGSAIYIGGTSWQRVRAPRAQVWRTINDASLYPRLLPGVDRAELVEERGNQRIVFVHHTAFFVGISYHVRVRIQRARYTVRFDLDQSRPGDVRDGRGFISLHRMGRDETLVTWGVMADLGSGVVTGVFAGAINDWILRVPTCVRGQVEAGQEGC